jgi:hypothetical protein
MRVVRNARSDSRAAGARAAAHFIGTLIGMGCPECARLKAEMERTEAACSSLAKQLSTDPSSISHNFLMQMRTAERDALVELAQLKNQIKQHQTKCRG